MWAEGSAVFTAPAAPSFYFSRFSAQLSHLSLGVELLFKVKYFPQTVARLFFFLKLWEFTEQRLLEIAL